MQPHQTRVVDEKKELDERATKLSAFIGTSPIFKTLDAAEQERMKEQCEIMWQYSEILGKRIAAFPASMPVVFIPTLPQTHSACLSYRHDYGILDEQARESLRETALDWWEAWNKEGVFKSA